MNRTVGSDVYSDVRERPTSCGFITPYVSNVSTSDVSIRQILTVDSSAHVDRRAESLPPQGIHCYPTTPGPSTNTMTWPTIYVDFPSWTSARPGHTSGKTASELPGSPHSRTGRLGVNEPRRLPIAPPGHEHLSPCEEYSDRFADNGGRALRSQGRLEDAEVPAIQRVVTTTTAGCPTRPTRPATPRAWPRSRRPRDPGR